MLSNEIVRKIEDFVYSKPRSVQEIAQHIEKTGGQQIAMATEMRKEFWHYLNKSIQRRDKRGIEDSILVFNRKDKLFHLPGDNGKENYERQEKGRILSF